MSQGKNVGQRGRQHKCQQCGTMFYGHFCGVCGAKVIEDVEFCPVCGQDREAHTSFCSNCGYAFGREMPERPVATVEPPKPPKEPRRSPTPTLESDAIPMAQEVPVETCFDIDENRKYRTYIVALLRASQKNTTAADIEQSIADLTSILGYQNSEHIIEQMRAYLPICREKEERAKKEAEAREEQRREKRKKAHRFFRVVAPVAFSVILLVVLTFTVFIPTGKMGKAKRLISNGQYSEAMKIYEALDGYGRSEKHLEVLKNIDGIQNGRYDKSIENILEVGIPVKIIFEMNGGTFGKDTGLDQQIVEQTYYDPADFDSLVKPKKTGTTFTQWEFGGIDYRVGKVFQINLTAIWHNNSYQIFYNLVGGKVDGHNPATYSVESDDIVLVPPQKEGYTFLGWTGTGVDTPTPNVTIPKGSTENRSYTAHWQANTYTITFDPNGGEVSRTSQLVTYRFECLLPIPTREGYVFAGWFHDGVEYKDGYWETDSDVRLVASWVARRYTIDYVMNGGANNSRNPTSYTAMDTITLEVPTKTGYIFAGWTYEGQSTPVLQVTIEPNGATHWEFTANWIASTNLITLDPAEGEVSIPALQVSYGSTYTLPTPTREGYNFIGWYHGDTRYAGGYSYTWYSLEDITLIANWTPIPEETTYVRAGNYIYFGEYPQTLKEKQVTITESKDDRGYYLGTDGAYYAKVTASPLFNNAYTFSNNEKIQEGMVYYFKVEPIKWRILQEENGKALLMCSSIIEQETFDSSSSNYAESDVRSWLITEFYNTAFNQLQQELILITKVNNGLESAGSTLDKFTGVDTYDKIFLLSYEEVTNELYGFAPASTTEDSARRLFGSDYTRAKGNYVNTGSSYYGTGQWWLRSPSISATHAQLISTGGTIGNAIIDQQGIVPALWIQLESD